MILKGSQRANGCDLAIHLMNGFDNEQVEIAQVYGTVAEDLYGAFAEFELIAKGTRAQNYLYSLSINPREPLSRAQYDEAITEIERGLGLDGQPRAVVFHIKDGREHCHVVWSRIDIGEMKAIHLSHDHSRLMDLSIKLAEKFGFELTPGQKAWADKHSFEKEKLEPTLAENAWAEESALSPDDHSQHITKLYEQTDSAGAFQAALAEQGYMLAKGGRRAFIVIDEFGKPYSLSRMVKGHTAKAIKAKLSALSQDVLPSVEEAQELQQARRKAQEQSRGGESDEGESGETELNLEAMRRQYEQAHNKRFTDLRTALRAREQELLIRQQDERLSLHAAQRAEGRGVLFRVRSAVTDLIASTPGLRSVLTPIQKLTHLDPRERHVAQNEALSRRHERERRDLDREKRVLARLETRERRSLEKAMRKAQAHACKLEGQAKHDFTMAASQRRAFEQGEDQTDLSREFNDAGEFAEGADLAAEIDDSDEETGWKARSKALKKGRTRRRGRGYGYRRDE